MNINDLKLLDYKDIVVGMRVKNNERITGIIKECDNIHNIFVEYDNGGSGLYCLVKDCIETTIINEQVIEIPHYDPLYQVK